MITIHTGLFPLTAIVAGGVLFALFRLWLRMRCQCRWAQCYIIAAVCLTLVLTFLCPYWQRSLERPIDPLTGKEIESIVTAPQPDAAKSSDAPAIVEKAKTDAEMSPSAEALIGKSRVRQTTLAEAIDERSPLTAYGWGGLLYLAGVVAMLLYFVAQLVWLRIQRKRSQLIGRESDADVYETQQGMPFSCGGSIFLPKNLDDEMRQCVVMHESSHVRHRHYAKLCAVELLLALGWFNPFVWLLVEELKMQYEREVDEDVLHLGLDRETYQLSLVRIAMKGSRWVLIRSHFGHHPLHLRILFMNKACDRKTYRRNAIAATAMSAAAIALIIVLSCSSHNEVATTPIDGVWTMDWYADEGSESINNPHLKHYLTVGNNAFICFTSTGRRGENTQLGFFGEEYRWTDSCVYRSRGSRFTVDFKDDGNTMIKHWTKFPDETTLAQGPDITEQWSRTMADEVIMQMLRQMQTATPSQQNSLYGVWRETTTYTTEQPKLTYFFQTMRLSVPVSNDSLIQSTYLCVWPGHVAFIGQTRRIDERINIGGSIQMGEADILSPDSVLLFADKEPVGLTINGDTLEMRHHVPIKPYPLTTRWQRATFPDDLRILLTSLPKE